MFKKIFFVFIFINFSNCGFVPINNIDNNKNLKIQNIEIISGDRKINMSLQRNLKKYQQNSTYH